MEKNIVLGLLFLFYPFMLLAENKPIDAETATYYEVALVKRYFQKGDWLSIVKTAKLLLKQEERELALQTIIWAERIIARKEIIKGTDHLVSFYKLAKMVDQKNKWEEVGQFWKNKKALKWKNE